MYYSIPPTVEVLGRDDIFIDGNHIDDIASESNSVCHITDTPHSNQITIRFMADNGVLHRDDHGPVMITAIRNKDSYLVTRISYCDYGKIHNTDGPAEMTFNRTTGAMQSVLYAFNHKAINHDLYVKDPFNPTTEEMFMMVLGEA